MSILDLIQHKRDGGSHSEADLRDLVQRITSNEIPDYQLSAWLMACYFQGLNLEETTILTDAMAHSGELLDLSALEGDKVDKHSTGGVGDKVTLVLAPLIASTGLIMAKLSGRGLGHTGGTVDKMEAIPGMQTSLDGPSFIEQLKRIGVAVIGQTQNIAPADKRLYALRDVTGTVSCIPLIVASVLSKKMASGANIIVLDVKYGSGAFMPDLASGQELARQLVEVGRRLDRKVSVLLSAMEQPLGIAVGHTLEVEEAIATLKGQGPADLTEVVLSLGAMQLCNAQRVGSIEEGKALLEHQIHSGKALLKMKELVSSQGGSLEVFEHPEIMPHAEHQYELCAPETGYVHDLVALDIGQGVRFLGGGRWSKEDSLDLGVGIQLWKKQGDEVKQGETLATIHYNDKEKFNTALKHFQEAYKISPEQMTDIPELIGDMIWSA